MIPETKEELLAYGRDLYALHLRKEAAWRERTGTHAEAGCITREAGELMKIYPRLRMHGLTLEDLTNGETSLTHGT